MVDEAMFELYRLDEHEMEHRTPNVIANIFMVKCGLYEKTKTSQMQKILSIKLYCCFNFEEKVLHSIEYINLHKVRSINSSIGDN